MVRKQETPIENASETNKQYTRIKDLPAELRADIEAMLEDGAMPSEVSRETGVMVGIVANVRRSLGMREKAEPEETSAISERHVLDDPEEKQHRRLDIRQRWLDQRQQMIDQRQQLIDQRQQSIDIRREHLELDDEFAEEEEPPEPLERDEQPRPTPELYDFDNNPLGSTLAFIRDLKSTPQRDDFMNTPPNAIQSPQSNATPDPTKPLSEAEIAAYVARTPPDLLRQVRAAIGTPLEGQLRQGLSEKFPGITPDNVDRIIAYLKATK